jgi:hypothetical protein
MNEQAAIETDTGAGPSAWQDRLLPLMSWMLVGLTLFFLLASFVQLAVLHDRINHAPTLDPALLKVDVPAGADAVAIARLTIEARLEANLIERRYHQANVAMMSRVWVHYLGFVTGMILSLMGSAFILGKVITTPSELEGKAGDAGGSLRTTSPGIVLCCLGVVLMITTMVVHHEIETVDKPTYFNSHPKPDEGGLPDTLTTPTQPLPRPGR